MVKLIIADSNDLARVGLRAIFPKEDISVLSEAECSSDFLGQLETFVPDVVLIDYTSDGFKIDVIPQALSINPQLKFVAITPSQSAQTVVHAIKSGVTSHVKKDCSLQEIVDSVVETAKGSKFFCGQILETIQKDGIDVEAIDEVDFTCDPVIISAREIEIITLIAEGLTNAQISEKLFLSKHTVNTHRKNIMNKLGVKNTAGIVMYAIKEEYISPNKFLFSQNN